MAQFLRLTLQNGSETEATSVIVNVDWVRCIDEIRPGHCRLVFAPDHAIPIDGPAANDVLRSLANVGGGRAREAALTDPSAEPYRLQVRQSPESEWHEIGPAGDSQTGLSCARLLASNECPGFKAAGGLHVRLVDSAGNTVWMLD